MTKEPRLSSESTGAGRERPLKLDMSFDDALRMIGKTAPAKRKRGPKLPKPEGDD